MSRALEATGKATVAVAKSDYSGALLLLGFAFPALWAVPAVAFGAAAVADATTAVASGTAKGIGGWWTRRRERKRQEVIDREMADRRVEEPRQAKERAELYRPLTVEERMANANARYRNCVALIQASELPDEEKQALINVQLDRLTDELRSIVG